MSWAGRFVFGVGWAAFRGRAADNSIHAHAALQLTLADSEPVTMRSSNSEVISGRSLLTRPKAPHALMPTECVTLLLIEPHAPLATFLLGTVGPNSTEPLPVAIDRQIDRQAPLERCLEGITPAAETRTLDPRLVNALDFLVTHSGLATVSDAAKASGLSSSRLRFLAQHELGLPLSSWQAWAKLERSGKALAAGASLADAALAGGFADQAHFTRTMRKVFGITPGTADELLQ